MGKLPAGISLKAASLLTVASVGMYGVSMATPRLGEWAVVYGAGLIGLSVIGALAPIGCRVIAIDKEDRQLELAQKLGADYLFKSDDQTKQKIIELTGGGADLVFEATGIPQLIVPAMELCRQEGKFVWQGHYGDNPIALPFVLPHGKRLTTYFPCDDGGDNSRLRTPLPEIV
jgi:threonine dehydrogenase-like Zn-dependent dehydrogenase